MTAVHQFVPTLEPSAVAAHTIEAQRVLRSLGIESEIFTDAVHPDFTGMARPYREFASRKEPSVALYQFAVGSAVADFLLERREPLLLNYHNITPARFFEEWDPGSVHAVTWGVAQLHKLSSRCDLAIAVSEYNRRELLDAGYRATAVAPVLVDLDAFEREVDEAALARLQDAKAGGGADLLFVGRVAPHKAQHDLIKALAVYRRLYDPAARLHLVGGSGSEAYSNALVRFADALGLADAVHITGSVSAGELAAHYRAADVLVCASEHEGFCVPLLEAMHHRLPIVAYGAAAVPETVADAGLVLDAKDPATVAAAIDRVLGDDELRRTLVEAGTARLADFTLERSRRRFAEALAPVLGEGA